MTRNEMLELMAHHIYILTETTIEDATSTADQILTAQEQVGMLPPPKSHHEDRCTTLEWDAE